jgi:hypothetical protein
MARFLLALILIGPNCAAAFVPRNQNNGKLLSNHHGRKDFSSRPLFALQQQQEDQTTDSNEQVSKLKQEAERMRLEAEKMEVALTLKKIEALEVKLNNKSWLAKHPDQEEDLKAQLVILDDRLNKKDTPTLPQKSLVTTTVTAVQTKSSPSPAKQKSPDIPQAPKEIPKNPMAGFDDADLELYVPIGKAIDEQLPNATIEEKLEAFRTAPELQTNFQKKIQDMLVGPLEDMQRLDEIKQQFLDSTSSREKENLKREIDRLENSEENGQIFVYTNSVYLESLVKLSEEETAERLEAVGSLPSVLQALYKQRNGVSVDGDLRLAIELDHYEPQRQLLDQVRYMKPVTEETRQEFIQGYESLPTSVQEHFAKNVGLEDYLDPNQVLTSLEADTSADESSWGSLMQAVEASSKSQSQSEQAEYSDIEFLDRSRFLREFYPQIGKMEGVHPAMEDVERFVSEVLDNKKTFMITSPPERVLGGYYIRGKNLLSGDDATEKMVQQVFERLANSTLADKLEFFYIHDPSPPTDEEMELGEDDEAIFVLTTKNPETFYSPAPLFTKGSLAITTLISTFTFSVGACALNPAISDRFYKTLDAASAGGSLDLQWLVDQVAPIMLSIAAIQLAHELGHRVIAQRDKVCYSLIGMCLVVSFVGWQWKLTIVPLHDSLMLAYPASFLPSNSD